MSGPTRYVQPGRHHTGSHALVLYDTTNPTNARRVFDGDSTWSNWVSDVFFFVLALIGLLLVYVMVNPESGRSGAGCDADGPASWITVHHPAIRGRANSKSSSVFG